MLYKEKMVKRTISKFTNADIRNIETDKRLLDRLEGDGFGVRGGSFNAN